jgi:hypothetical protein
VRAQTCAQLQLGNFSDLFQQVCGGQSNWGPWLSVRGRCEKYRGEEESCNAHLAEGAFGPRYVTGTDGRPPRGALVCAPGLACTGEFGPLPHTCVKARPPNACFQGPWWDSSSWCKVGGADGNGFTGGLPRDELERIAPALMLQLPTEVFHNPEVPGFWQARSPFTRGGCTCLQRSGDRRQILNSRAKLDHPPVRAEPSGGPGARLHRGHRAGAVAGEVPPRHALPAGHLP